MGGIQRGSRFFGGGGNAFKVVNYYYTDWVPEFELPLKTDGLRVDKVYENFVQQIAGDALRSEEGKAETLKESMERDIHRQELKKLNREQEDL